MPTTGSPFPLNKVLKFKGPNSTLATSLSLTKDPSLALLIGKFLKSSMLSKNNSNPKFFSVLDKIGLCSCTKITLSYNIGYTTFLLNVWL